MNATRTIALHLREPRWCEKRLLDVQVLMVLAAGIALLAVQDPGPIHLMLFLVGAQALIIIGVVVYLVVTVTNFLRRRRVSRVHFAPGETIFRQGDPEDSFYTIINGQVEIVSENPEWGETVLARLGPGQCFDEMGLVNNAPHMATARTVTPVDVVTIAREDFTTLYAYLPDFRQGLAKGMLQYGAAPYTKMRSEIPFPMMPVSVEGASTNTRPSALSKVTVTADEALIRGRSPGGKNGEAMKKAKILVVDDDRGLLTLMKVRLEAAGYRVTLAEGGAEALARASQEVYELAIVDLKMEDMDGMTLLEKLLCLHPHLPVIILTAHATIASAVEATKKGAYDYLTKPFEPKQLLQRLAGAFAVS